MARDLSLIWKRPTEIIWALVKKATGTIMAAFAAIGRPLHISTLWASRFGVVVGVGLVLGIVSLDEYAIAEVVWLASAVVLGSKAVHWKGFVDRAAATRLIRGCYILSAVAFMVFGAWVIQVKKGNKPWTGLTSAVNHRPEIPRSKREHGPPLPPAGFISLIGQVLDGSLAMLQENQTDTPLDDVHLSITQFFPASESANGGPVGWQKELDIGTSRAKLTIGLPERLPIGGQQYIPDLCTAAGMLPKGN